MAPTPSEPRGRTLASAAGQTLPLVVVFMFSILVFAGLVIDFGNAYRVQKALQASADASAAAGAGQLTLTYPPVTANATVGRDEVRLAVRRRQPDRRRAVRQRHPERRDHLRGTGRLQLHQRVSEHGDRRRDGQRADVPAEAARVPHDHAQGARPGVLAVRRRAARRDDRARPHRVDVPEQQAHTGEGRHQRVHEDDGPDPRLRRPGGAAAGAERGPGLHRRDVVLQRHEEVPGRQPAVQRQRRYLQLRERRLRARAAVERLRDERRQPEQLLAAHVDDQLRPGRRRYRVRRGDRRRLRGAAEGRPRRARRR